jgi:oxygen-dependent protoporphyrinogen oxidase
MRKSVLILGGGVTGLTAAYRLRDLAASGAADVTLLEASPRVGGIIDTAEDRDADGRPVVMERGPDCFISNKPAGVGLVAELGLSDRLIPTNPAVRRSFILRGGRLVPIPAGFYLIAPNSTEAVRGTGLFSPAGEDRIAAEPTVPPRAWTDGDGNGDADDESLADFVTRRLGAECLERFAQPMVAGITTSDPAKLSMRALMPQFVEMERSHGSVIRGLAAKKARDEAAAEAAASGPRYGLFLSFRNGMRELIDGLSAALPAGTVQTRARVTALRRNGSRWRAELSGPQGPETLEADAVVCTLPTFAAAELLRPASAELADGLAGIEYAPCAAVNIVLRRGQVAHPLDGMGFVVPAAEGRFVIACSFSSVKFAGRAAEGTVLLRAFVGGALRAGDVGLSDAEMTARTLADLRDILGLTGEPALTAVAKWPRSMPQYHVGHLARVAAIERLAAGLPGLFPAGNAYRGVGIPDSILSATAAADSARRWLGLPPRPQSAATAVPSAGSPISPVASE